MNRIGLSLLYQQSHIPGGESLTPGSKVVGGNLLKILHGGGTADDEGLTVEEYERRKTLELSWRYHLSRSVMVTALVPFVETQVTSTGTLITRGLGDATLLGHYVVENLFSKQTPSTLILGGGVTIPTGTNNLHNSQGERIDNRLQPGSGAVGVAGEILLTTPLDKWTTAIDLYGKVNSANSYGDRIGPSFSATATVNHDIYRNNPSNFGVVGIGGLRSEIAGQDNLAGTTDPTSGSETLWVNLGGEIVYHQFKLEASTLLPVAQRREPGGADEDIRLHVGLRYEFW